MNQLTDEELTVIIDAHEFSTDPFACARAVIAAHDERVKQNPDELSGCLDSSIGIPTIAAPIPPTEEIESHCALCGRCAWSRDEIGTVCAMPQPDGSNCGGVFTVAAPIPPTVTPSQQEKFCGWTYHKPKDAEGFYNPSCLPRTEFDLQGGFCPNCGKTILALPEGEKK